MTIHIDLKKYFAEKDYKATGRPRYEREKLLKVLLFAFMEYGYLGTVIEDVVSPVDGIVFFHASQPIIYSHFRIIPT